MWHYPISNDLAKMLDEVMAALESTGFDPFVGRKLFSFLNIANASAIHTQIEPYHFIQGTIDNAEKELWALKLDIAKRSLGKLKSIEFAEDVCGKFMKHLESPDTFTYSNIFTVTGTVSG